MRRDYDVIVVGAGPGGSTAAYELARQGIRVGLFEKQPLPRAKPCGGCLSLKINRILTPDFHPLIEHLVHRSLYWRFLTQAERPYHDCLHSSITTFAHGLSTVVVVRQCCRVAAPVLPDLESLEVAV